MARTYLIHLIRKVFEGISSGAVMHLTVSNGSFWAGKPLIGLIKSFTNTPGFKGVKKPPEIQYCWKVMQTNFDKFSRYFDGSGISGLSKDAVRRIKGNWFKFTKNKFFVYRLLIVLFFGKHRFVAAFVYSHFDGYIFVLLGFFCFLSLLIQVKCPRLYFNEMI